ncbi:PAS domain-containing two-component system sensor histidine kinase/response regulator [Planomonospora sphaerica]|uniref:Sensor-like histidine kinase SenX3 n=1 Tax=Planomonospora sphaerica TaxID=161355 RepID=A0A161LP67_9ACTN|nr:ATP-binding protein [Planomonospora sphaerica]GAT71437.1 PAS domain-containing two-component system sensor histidine kinase/response regulator [Planomonospora sphaerica]
MSTQREMALVALIDDVTAVAGATDDLHEAARATLSAVCRLTGWPLGHLGVPADDGEAFVSSGIWVGPIGDFPLLAEIAATTRFVPGTGIIGQVAATGEPVWSRDLTTDPLGARLLRGRDPGVRAAFAFPVIAVDGVAAVLQFFSEQVIPRDEPLLRVMTAIGYQLGGVADRRKLRDTVQAGRDRLRQVIDTSVEGFISTDTAGHITEWNTAAERMFGRSRQEVLGRLVHETIVPPRYRKADRAGRARFLATGESKVLGRRLELAGARPDGSEFPIEIVVWATREAGAWAFHAFIHDITDRRRAEHALRQAYEAEQATVARLTELDEAKDAFIATVSHELRTPLTSLAGYLELLDDAGVDVDPVRHRRMLEAMTRSTARLQNLVEDLLAVNALGAGELPVHAAAVPVRPLIEEAVRAASAQTRSSGHRVEIRTDAGAQTVTADRDLLVRAINALLSNAVKYSPIDTPITVHTSAAGGQVAIAVTDRGVGIDADELPRVFERFYRARYAHEHAVQGVGLGLWLVKTIAEAHGGTIGAVSTPGEGSTFTLSLPAAGPDTAPSVESGPPVTGTDPGRG